MGEDCGIGKRGKRTPPLASLTHLIYQNREPSFVFSPRIIASFFVRVTVEGRLIPPTVSSLKGNFVTARLENHYKPTVRRMELLCTSKHRVWSIKRSLVRNIPETFKVLR